MEALRRIVARFVIGTFALAAALGIYALLKPGPLGEVEGNVLLTTTIVGVAALAALCYLASSASSWWLAGAAGAVVAVVPVTISLVLVWGDWSYSDGWWRTYGVSMTLALTLAQISLLAGLTGDARRRQRWLLISTALIAAAVAAVIIMLLLSDGGIGDDVMRLLGVLAILDALGSITLIALRVFGGRVPSSARRGPEPFVLDAGRSTRLRRLATAHGVSADLMLDRLLTEAERGPTEPPANQG
ncbi:hypothetical protein [Aeromicrobium piscarium]|uniref:Uncharacterized protein n=1 Tax=Aeromicrobium piscarium TaxID=2590901 RepID=A0A554SQ77_9ACTN|nr:hypothetical protein [Aeromicrobium piscarium]TSD68504.1 hypothetical protein FNM00_02640 [Aeromicrobium piscarium]